MSLRRLLMLLLLVLAPLPIAAAEPAWACPCAVAASRSAGPAFGADSTAEGSGGRLVTLSTVDDVVCAGAASECTGDGVVNAARSHREHVERVSAYRTSVFWAGSGLVVFAVAGGMAWVLRLPGGRVAAMSGPDAACRPRDGQTSAGRCSARTESGQ